LEPQLFERLQVPKTIESIIAVKTAADWWHRRDRAMLALLVETGVTTSELIALRGKDLKRVDRAPLDVKVLRAQPEGPVSLQLDVLGGPAGMGRTLRISERYSYLLLDWLGFRRVLLSEWSAKVAAMEEGGPVPAGQSDESPLFLARRARIGGDELPALEAVTVYYAVSKALDKLRSQVLPPLTPPSVGLVPGAPHVAKGPAVIRNSVIRAWLDSVGPVETVRRAGLQSVDSLRLPARVVEVSS
jgi:integrase